MTDENRVDHVIRKEPYVEVEVTTSAKGVPQPAVKVIGADEEVVEAALRHYEHLRQRLQPDEE